METLKNIGILLGSLFLVVLAVCIITLVTPVAFLWKLYVSLRYDNRKAREIVQGTAEFFVAIASSLDKFGNCAFGGFLNAILLRKKRYKFGRNHETISEVLGWAERYNDLTPLGELLKDLVNFLDFTTKDHCKKAMLYGVEHSREKVELYEALNPQPEP